MKFVGEIGVDRKEYLYHLSYCDIVQMLRGYERRLAHWWGAFRWQTHWLVVAQRGSEEMKRSGISSPADMLRFPWEGKEQASQGEQPSADEVQRLRRMMEAENAAIRKERRSG